MSNVIGNRFEILEEIQHGQMANSYRALDVLSGKTIFLKILHPALKTDEDILLRFKREVKLAGALKHPNVVKLIESGEIEGSLYISFEWLEGKLLSECFNEINDDNPIKINEAASCIAQILSGLQAIHESGIIHRDLKPGNILIDKNGNSIILDFSLASAGKDSRITAHGNIVGTPGYLAPEVIAGGIASTQSDLFAVGIMFYELLSGQALFSSDDIYLTLQKVHEADIQNLNQFREDIPAELDDFIKKLLEKHPGDRYRDASTALNELMQIKSIEIEKTVPLILTPDGKGGNYKHIIAAAIMTIVVLSGYLYIYKNQDTSSEDGSTANIEKEDTSNTILNRLIISPDKTIDESRADIDEAPTLKDTIDKLSESSGSPDNAAGKPEIISENPPDGSVQNNRVEKLKSESVIPENAGLVDNSAEQEQIGSIVSTDSIDISITVVPWAKVFIDGKFLGTTPLLQSSKCRLGVHTMRLEHPDFPTLMEIIEFNNAESANINIDLANEFGRLDFQIIPWGDIVIDDMPEGAAPLAKPIFVVPGEHVVRVQHPNFDEVVRSVIIEAGELFIVNVDFTKNE